MKFPAFVLLIALSASAQTAHWRNHGAFVLPDRHVTPGAVDPRAVADPSGASHVVDGVERNICAKTFRTGPIRASIRNFPKLKREACAEYGVTQCDKSVEGDHLISIELGGCPDCLANIQPQPMDQARVKDHRVENLLPDLVCAGKITLADAQRCVADDWVACGERIAAMK